MVIEWLRVTVPVGEQARYLACDREIWTGALARQAGFLGKEVWVREGDPESVNLVIRWESREAWKAVPVGLLEETEAAFRAAMGGDYPVLECIEYEVAEEGVP